MLINDDIKLDYSDVLIRPKRSTLTSRFDEEMNKTYTFYHSKKKWTGIPIMAANMDTVGTFQMYDKLTKHNMITCIARHYNYDESNWWKIVQIKGEVFKEIRTGGFCCVMGGISDEDIEIQSKIHKEAKCDFLGLDVANGYTISFVDAVKKTRDINPDATIIAGNVVTSDMTQELILAGADIVKVGVGPGSVCTTRIKTGIGYPQLSAVIECADAAHGLGGHIIADGGCNSSGDIAKAFAAGADFVMIGGMLAGHDECDGEIKDGKMSFYGMASESAMDRHGVGNREYRGVEGKTVTVPYRGPVENTLVDIMSGVRSACTYVGANKLKDLSKCATFIRVNNTHNRVYE